MATVQRPQPRLLVLAYPNRVWSPILNYATSTRVRGRIAGERAAELAIWDWVVSLCEKEETSGNMFLVENPVDAISWNQLSIRRLGNAPFAFEDMSHLFMFGDKDPRSRRLLKRRQLLDKQLRAVEICRSKASEQTCSRTGERTHECVSEFILLAHTCLGASSDQGSGERCCQET